MESSGAAESVPGRDRWVGPLVLVTAVAMILVGFHFAHFPPNGNVASAFVAPVRLSNKTLPGSAQYSLDAVSYGSKTHVFGGGTSRRTISIDPGTSVTIYGWAVDSRAADAAAGLFVDVDSKTHVACVYGISRADVAKAMSKPFYTDSGFEVVVPSRLLSKGSHDIALDVYAHDGSGSYRDANILTVTVR